MIVYTSSCGLIGLCKPWETAFIGDKRISFDGGFGSFFE